MATLHIVNRAASSSHALQQCLDLASPGDAVLLIEDGVYSALPRIFSGIDLTSGVTVSVLATDVDARGLEGRLTAAVASVDYDGFVTLTEQHNPVMSWF